MPSESALMPEVQTRLSPAATPMMTIPMPWLTLPALSGILLWMCFYPLGWGFLGWVALVPLLCLVRLEARPRLVSLGAFVGGAAFYLSAISWMTVADYRMVYTWLALSIYCALYFPIALAMIRRLERATNWPLTLTVPIVWTALEFVRSFLGTGFAWYYLGHSQHHYLALIQVADLAGVYAVSFVMAAANGWLAERLLALPDAGRFLATKPSLRRGGSLGWALALAAASMVGYGILRLTQDDFATGPRVALLQGNIDQRIRNEADGDGGHAEKLSVNILEHYWHLFEASRLAPGANLVVWPETSYPFAWFVMPPDLNMVPERLRDVARVRNKLLRDLIEETGRKHLIGLNVRVVEEGGTMHPFSSALLMTENGSARGLYHKIHRVPFGEYVPLRESLPFMNAFAPYDGDYSIGAGDKLTRFSLETKSPIDDKRRDYTFGVLICYEDTDPFLARQYARDHADGPPVDFLLNISNDGWFDGSRQHAEHLAIARFRAVETRRTIARAVNMGISAVIDGNGRVQKPQLLDTHKGIPIWQVKKVEGRDGATVPDLPESEWGEFTKVQGVLTAELPIDRRVSVYALLGDWLPGTCWAIMVGVWIVGFVRRRPSASGAPAH